MLLENIISENIIVSDFRFDIIILKIANPANQTISNHLTYIISN